MSETKSKFFRIINPTVLIAALGYFVDLFDITLFGAVRTSSLKSLGLTDPNQILEAGVRLYNWQMGGMLIGGVLWGILGDKKGRVSVLYGSILMYSLANIANAFVGSVWQYEVLRFLAGVGLAGELGAAVTLVSEVMSKEDRGYGTTVVATLGMLGSMSAAFAGKLLDWNYAYILGGVLGLSLLAARLRSFDSEMFEHLKQKKVKMGNVGLLLAPRRALRYLSSVAIGVPIYFITAIFLTLAPEITSELNIQGTVTAPDALIYGSVGLAVGDLVSGLVSQWMGSRKKAIALFLGLAMTLIYFYTHAHGATPQFIYFLCLGLGTCAGYWAVLVTTAAEQFGTDIRSTVATSVPNFVRGSGMLVATSFIYLKSHYTKIDSALIIAGVCFGLALLALLVLHETYGKNLDFIEADAENEVEKKLKASAGSLAPNH